MVMTEISWTVLALFGLAVAGYGVFLFIALAGAGMFVVLIALELGNGGAKNQTRLTGGSSLYGRKDGKTKAACTLITCEGDLKLIAKRFLLAGAINFSPGFFL